jgi:hypothetical protein
MFYIALHFLSLIMVLSISSIFIIGQYFVASGSIPFITLDIWENVITV